MDDDPYSELDNESRTYIGLHDAMMDMYYKEDNRGWIDLASKLLTVSQLTEAA